LLELALERLRLLLAERPHLRVIAVRELLGRGQLLLEAAIRGEIPRHGLELGVLARQLAKTVLVGDRLRIAQQARELLVALRERGQLLANRFVHDAIVSQRRHEPRRRAAAAWARRGLESAPIVGQHFVENKGRYAAILAEARPRASLGRTDSGVCAAEL